MKVVGRRIKVCEPPKTPEWVRGKVLFNTAKYPMTSRRWIACNVVPSGRPHGRPHLAESRRGCAETPSLFGCAHTHPLHWSDGPR